MTYITPPWTMAHCCDCGDEYQATRQDPREIAVYRCPVCTAWNDGYEARVVEDRGHEIRARNATAMLRRVSKYVREDKASTQGSTRLARLVDQIEDLLARDMGADILRVKEQT